MEYGKLYRVIKRVKIHTKPLIEADVVQIGKFIKETPKRFVFDEFQVYKANIISATEL